MAVGALVEVARQGRDRLAEPAHPAEQEPPVAAVVGVGRLEDGSSSTAPSAAGQSRAARCAARRLRRTRARISRRPAGRSMPAWNRTPSPTARRISAWQSSGVSRSTAAGRVDQEAVRAADDEVARQPDAVERQADPPGDLELDDREADRQADAAPGDEVEQAVARVVVLRGGRSAEAGLAVEHVVQPVDRDVLRVADVEADPDPLGERVEDRQRRSRDRDPGRPSAAIISAPIARSISASGRATMRANAPAVGGAGGLVVRHPGIVRREPTRQPIGEAVVCSAIPTGPVGYPVEEGDRRDRRANRARPLAPPRPPRPGLPDAGSRAADDRRIRRPVRGRSGIVDLLARLERGRPIRIADLVDRLNATYLDWLFPTASSSTRSSSSRRTGWPTTATPRGSSLDDGAYGPTIEVEDSSRVDPWIVRQAEREPAACRERLDAFSRLDRAGGEG